MREIQQKHGSWMRYEPGDEVQGMRVLEVGGDNPYFSTQTVYKGVLVCCETHHLELTHKQIRARISLAPRLCPECAKKAGTTPYNNLRVDYSPGDVVGGAEILGPIEDADERMRGYMVRWLCCDRTGTVVHRSLASRDREGKTICRACSRAEMDARLAAERLRRKARKEEMKPPPPNYGVEMPLWPRPSSVAPGYWLWGAR